MPERKVLLRKRPDGRGYDEVAIVLDLQRKQLRLQLPDGTIEERDRQTDEITPVEGSFMHLLRVAPEAIARALEDRPELVFRKLLADSRGAATAKDLKTKLADFDSVLVDKAWTKAKKVLDADPDVSRGGSNGSAYKFRGDVSAFAALFPPRAVTSPHDPIGSLVESPAPHARPIVSQDESQVDGSKVSALEARENEALHATEPVTADSNDDVVALPTEVATRSETPTPALIQTLDALGVTPKGARNLESLAARPLYLHKSLARRKLLRDPQFLEGLDDSEISVLACAGLVEVELSGAQHKATLEAARREIAGAQAPNELLGPLSALLDRAEDAKCAEPGAMVELAKTLARVQPGAAEGLQDILTRLAKHVDRDGVNARGWDLTGLARAAARVPLTRTGGRTALLAALFRRLPDEAVRDIWWQGVSFEQLEEAGHGPLEAVLRHEAVMKRVARPLIAEFLNGINYRSGIARIFTLPAVLASELDGDRLRAAMVRTGQRDEHVSRWLQDLANTEKISALEATVAEQTRAAEAGRMRLEQLESEVGRLRERLAVASEGLAQARLGHSDDRSAHDRQIRLDVLRALATVAALVFQTEHARHDTALVRNVTYLLGREGLTPLHAPGDEVAFDPEMHDALGQGLVPDSAARVVRGGYTWADRVESLVLLKAQVVAIGS